MNGSLNPDLAQGMPMAPLAVDAGVRVASPPADPWLAFAELMELLEALSPTWPERTCSRGDDYRL